MQSFSTTVILQTRRRRGLRVFYLLLTLTLNPASAQSQKTLPTTASAVQTPTETPTVTWLDIVRLVDQHPRLAAGRLMVMAARGAVGAAGAVPNPSLDATIGGGATRDGDLKRIEKGFELTVPLGWIAQRGHKMAAAMAELDASQSDAEALRREILLQLRVLFWNLVYDQTRVAALTDLEAQTADLARIVRRRVEAGEARPVEKARVEVELEKVASELDAARVSLGVNREQLQLWLGGEMVRELRIEADLSAVPTIPDLDPALIQARSSHPSIKAARARVEARAAEVAVEKLARIPSLALKAFTDEEIDRRAYGGGIVVDIPVWNWNAGRIAQAQAQWSAGKKQLEAQARDLDSSIIESHGACLAASRTAIRLRDGILPRSEAAAATMERTYQLGEASLLEAIDARRVLVETRRTYLAALVETQIDCSRFNALIGEEDEQ